MQLRKDRAHHCGLSNLDFRTQKDSENLTKYQEDFKKKSFGTMGRIGIKQVKAPTSEKEKRKLKAGFILEGSPNPRDTVSKMYYDEAEKPIREKAAMGSTRISHVEDPRWNENIFTGENVNELQQYRKKVGTPLGFVSKATLPQFKTLLKKGDKLEKHAKATQETQLVKVTSRHTLEGKVDLDKVKEIRRTIRRRYANRTNFRKIFNLWDANSKGRVDHEDVHFMVNKFGIKVNINESKVLVASVDQDFSGSLAMDEFLDLIFSADESLNVDLSKIRDSKAKEPLISVEHQEDITERIKRESNNLRLFRNKNQFKSIVQKKIRDIANDLMSGDSTKSNMVGFEEFKEIIERRSKFPKYLQKDEMLAGLFKDFDVTNQGKINYRQFVESIRTFNYESEEEKNVDLGRRTMDFPYEEAQIMREKKLTEKIPLQIEDNNKVPENKLQLINIRTIKMHRILKNKFTTEEALRHQIQTDLQQDSYGNVKLKELEDFFLKNCRDEILTRKIGRRDIEGFLSSFVYNQYNMTNLDQIPKFVFSDQRQIENRLYTQKRAACPPEYLTRTKSLEVDGDLTTISKTRVRNLLKEIEDKAFDGKIKMFGVFRKFDKDGDGYVSYQDLEDHLKSLKVFVTKGEFNHLITLFDKEKKGFLDFKRFSTSITPKMSQNLVEDDQEDENYMFKKDRNFLIPSKDKVQDNLRFAKTFTEKMNAIKNTLLPDKDMILNLKPATRFGSTPAHKNTFGSFCPSPASGMHLPEQLRVQRGNLNSNITFQKAEKDMRSTFYEAKLQRMRDNQKNLANRIEETNMRKTIYDQQKIQNKINRFQVYETKCHNPYL